MMHRTAGKTGKARGGMKGGGVKAGGAKGKGKGSTSGGKGVWVEASCDFCGKYGHTEQDCWHWLNGKTCNRCGGGAPQSSLPGRWRRGKEGERKERREGGSGQGKGSRREEGGTMLGTGVQLEEQMGLPKMQQVWRKHSKGIGEVGE